MRSFAKALLLLAPLTLLACGSDSGPKETCEGDRCDDLDLPDSQVMETKCDGVMIDHSGRKNGRVAGRLHDPIAKLLWHDNDTCPSSYQDIMAKLRQVDTENCEGERDGIRTRVVSETAQLANSPTSYRLVTTRQCGDREDHEIVFSLFGVPAGAESLPAAVEVMAFDKDAGVFNYYEASGGEIHFFGNSRDMLRGADGTDRRCAGCHTGGGLVMKELDTPWMHWEGHMDTPGAADLVSAHPDLGSKADGRNMEGLTNRGNKAWNAARVDFLLEKGTVRDLLKPLFCTVEVNVDNGGDFPTTEMTAFTADSILDPKLKSFGFVNIETDDYNAQMATNGQEVPRMGETDTAFAYAFIERSKADINFVDILVERDIITEEFMKDVLAVDFTRPIFSDDRCALLDKLPDFSPANGQGAALSEAVKTAFAGSEALTPAGDFLANLSTDKGHNEIVNAFFESCEDLDSPVITERALQIQSLNRESAGRLQVFEFPETLPTDNQNISSGSRFDPRDCSLIAERYVSISTANP